VQRREFDRHGVRILIVRRAREPERIFGDEARAGPIADSAHPDLGAIVDAIELEKRARLGWQAGAPAAKARPGGPPPRTRTWARLSMPLSLRSARASLVSEIDGSKSTARRSAPSAQCTRE